MAKLFYSLLLAVLLVNLTGCRKVLKSVSKEAAKQGISELAKKSDERSKQTSPQISDAQIKREAKAANVKLNSYREQCSKYKKIFDTVSTPQHYNQSVNEFNMQYNHFYGWLQQQSFRHYSPSPKFASQYKNWYTKFERYHKNYTDAVKKSQHHRYNELNK